ncbi:calponin homology domain-containing protein DDB_G0272472-like [Anabas testudineus]|uniref:calponin homology domain-containing protein DDB_G0272472-like n=1 Tax=Anabas testudineus TaxID=64144 RepID=UPI000E45C33A|nr:calponin homology domain-containing protein DDB_G0272472-like [Anabas testudineus]
MEKRYNSKTGVPRRAQRGNTTQYFRPHPYMPAAAVPPSLDVHDLRQTINFAHGHHLNQSSQYVALMQHIDNLAKTNQGLVHENRCLQGKLGRKLHMAKKDIKELEWALQNEKDEKASRQETGQDKKWEETIREKDKELCFLRECLSAQKLEKEAITDFYKNECDKLKAAFENELKNMKSACDAAQTAALQQMQADCQRAVNELQGQLTEKDNVISSLQSEMKARADECLSISSQLSLKELELMESRNWCNALEEKFKKELEEKEEHSKRRQKEMEELWAARELALMKKARKAEEDLERVVSRNFHLQELRCKKKKRLQRQHRGLCDKKKQRSGSVDEPGTARLAPGSFLKEEKEAKDEQQSFMGEEQKVKRVDEEVSVCKTPPACSTSDSSSTSDQTGSKKKRREERRGFWGWVNKRNRHSRGEERAASVDQAKNN